MNILLLRGFNNYFNRIVKKYSTLEDYRTESSSYLDLDNINFNPNDGIATELIIGSTNQKENNEPLDWENIGTPDYLVCYEGDPSEIKSRWFILESERTRNGQYRIALKRDVLAEHFSQIMTAPCFVEKGFINNTNNPLLFTSEGRDYNQIKQSETPLKDETGCGWLVGYLKKDHDSKNITSYIIPETLQSSIIDVKDIDWEDAIDFYDKNGVLVTPATSKIITDTDDGTAPSSNPVFGPKLAFAFEHVGGSPGPATICIQNLDTKEITLNNCRAYSISREPPTRDDWSYYGISIGSTLMTIFKNLFWTGPGARVGFYLVDKTVTPFDYTNLNTYLTMAISGKWIDNGDWAGRENSLINYTQSNRLASKNAFEALWKGLLADFTRLNNIHVPNSIREIQQKTYILKNNKLYSYSLVPDSTSTWTTYHITAKTGTDLRGSLVRNFQDSLQIKDNDSGRYNIQSITFSNSNQVDYTFKAKPGKVVAIEIASEYSFSTSVPSSTTRTHVRDDLFDIFAIPFIKNTTTPLYFSLDGSTTKTISSEVSLVTANQIMLDFQTSGAGAQAYDLQLLPYCPLDFPITKINGNNVLDLSKLEDSYYKTIVNEASNEPASFILFPNKSNFTKNISFSSAKSDNPLELKIQNECDFCRLVSPNFNGMFEFKKSKLDTGISYFNVDCTYKPYTPYIKLNPNFSFLYGNDFNDSTGLILGGDFSLSTLSDAWTQYELSNKNYQKIFDRQIQNMEVNNQIAREQQEFSGIIGILTGGAGGAAGGAMAGAKIGGGYGAIAGAAVGASAGLVGGILGYEKDKEWLARQQAENRSYAIDNYNYQIGNVKALPQSISKSSPLTYNNKIWPILEEYSCTQEEKDILRNVIKYDGMKVMCIDQLERYSSSPFENTYVKGRMVRLEGLDDDFHIADAIYAEVNKGFYVPQE